AESPLCAIGAACFFFFLVSVWAETTTPPNARLAATRMNNSFFMGMTCFPIAPFDVRGQRKPADRRCTNRLSRGMFLGHSPANPFAMRFPVLHRVAFGITLILVPLRAEKIVLVAGGDEDRTNIPATYALLKEPFGVDFDRTGNLFIIEMV